MFRGVGIICDSEKIFYMIVKWAGQACGSVGVLDAFQRGPILFRPNSLGGSTKTNIASAILILDNTSVISHV